MITNLMITQHLHNIPISLILPQIIILFTFYFCMKTCYLFFTLDSEVSF